MGQPLSCFRLNGSQNAARTILAISIVFFIRTAGFNIKAFDRIKNLLNGRLANGFPPEQINAHSLVQSQTHLKVESSLEVIHDGLDIRKTYSKGFASLNLIQSPGLGLGQWLYRYGQDKLA